MAGSSVTGGSLFSFPHADPLGQLSNEIQILGQHQINVLEGERPKEIDIQERQNQIHSHIINGIQVTIGIDVTVPWDTLDT